MSHVLYWEYIGNYLMIQGNTGVSGYI